MTKKLFDIGIALPFFFIATLANNTFAEPLPDVLRTGGPSNPNDAKIAILVSEKSYDGKPFEVVDENNNIVYKGKLNQANKPTPWQYAATADLSDLKKTGRYTIQVETLKSRIWEINDNANSALIAKLLGLFQANRDGYEPSSLHKPSHLHDAIVKGGPYDGNQLDLTGGWMDAGDQLHFTSTTAYASVILQIAAKLDPLNAVALNNEADVGIRWLLKAHPQPDLFIGQVGDASDHAEDFRDPAIDDISEKQSIGYRFAYPSGSSSIMGKTAAALALAAERYTGEAHTQLLTHAQQWYQQGKANQQTEELLPGDFYTDPTWHDDLSLAAVMLWRATGSDEYLNDAIDYLTNIDELGFSTSSVGVLAGADLCGVVGHEVAHNLRARKLGCELLRATAEEAISNTTAKNAPWGTPGNLSWGQTGNNGAAGAIIALAKRAGLTKNARPAAFARDWMLGLNPWGASFVVGYGENSPETPHHWASVFGKNLPEGAVTGGPVSNDEMKQFAVLKKGQFDSDRAMYSQEIENFVTNEAALDCNASSILLLAAIKTLN